MLELQINAQHTGAITLAFRKIHDMVMTGAISSSEPVHLILESGTYHEIISYNLSNPLVMESVRGCKAEDCIVSAENCEAFHKDTENRALFVIGLNATKVTLRNFTLINTHVKTMEDAGLGNQAEALCWHNYKGALFAENVRFFSHQDTIHVKGFSHFLHCYVEGDVDYIWGYCDTSLFEECILHTCEDNRGDDRIAYVLQSRALNGKRGFIFKDCLFTAAPRKSAPVYMGRSSGTGKPESPDRWDSIALINCTLDSNYAPELWTDENGTRNVFPDGQALIGWREYGTKTKLPDGRIVTADTTKRYKKNYILTDDEFSQYYASRFIILRDTPLLAF